MVLKVVSNEWPHYKIFLATQNDQKNIVLQGKSFKTFKCQKASLLAVEFDFASLW